MYYLAIIIAAAGTFIYHLSMKKLPQGLNPLFSLAIVYFMAFALCLSGMMLWPTGSKQLQAPWSMLGIALGIIGIELGFLLAYRTGWHVGYAGITVNAISVLLLLPIAILFFKQGLTFEKIFGIVFCLAGLFFLMRPS